MSDDKSKSPIEELSMATKALGAAFVGMKPILVSVIASTEHVVKSAKANAFSGHLQEYLLTPIDSVRQRIDDAQYSHSNLINNDYKFLASLARSHQGQFITTTSLGLGALCAIPLKALKLPGGGPVFKYVTLLTVPITYGFTKLADYKWQYPREN